MYRSTKHDKNNENVFYFSQRASNSNFLGFLKNEKNIKNSKLSHLRYFNRQSFGDFRLKQDLNNLLLTVQFQTRAGPRLLPLSPCWLRGQIIIIIIIKNNNYNNYNNYDYNYNNYNFNNYNNNYYYYNTCYPV